MSNDNDCPICLEKLLNCMTTKCQHQFHTLCLEKWLEKNSSCPICRHIINPTNLSYSSPDFVTIYVNHYNILSIEDGMYGLRYSN
jgi:hypothetical protein